MFGGRCLVMGILNVTPDSFSDGGQFATADSAVARAHEIAAEGADLIDIGGESTRPGSHPVPAAVQIRRVVPVIQRLRAGRMPLPLSIDTRSAAVAAAALDAGADIINDISAARHDPDMPRLLADRRVPFIAMHMQGAPETMQIAPTYRDVVAEVRAFFDERAESLANAGVDVGRMMIDPGIGFGKTLEHNLALLRAIGSFRGRWPVLVGPSRKRFITELAARSDCRGPASGLQPAASSLSGTAAVVAHCAIAGVEMVRVHDIRPMRQVVDLCRHLA